MFVDVDIKHYYEKYCKNTESDLAKYQKAYDEQVTNKNKLRSWLNEKIEIINKSIGINLKDYGTEWIIAQYNPKLSLLDKAKSKLKYFDEFNEERIMIMQIIRYCQVLYNCRKLNILINLCKDRQNLSYKKYCELVRKYYRYGVHKCLLEGYAYHFGYGIGVMTITRFKFDDNYYSKKHKKKVDWQATKKNKEKLLAEGKELYNKDKAEAYRLKGLKYDGIKYVKYLENQGGYVIQIRNNKYIGNRNLEYKEIDYLNAKYRKKTTKEIAATFKDKEEIYDAPFDIRTKMNVLLQYDKTSYINFIRSNSGYLYAKNSVNSNNLKRY